MDERKNWALEGDINRYIYTEDKNVQHQEPIDISLFVRYQSFFVKIFDRSRTAAR